METFHLTWHLEEPIVYKPAGLEYIHDVVLKA